MYTTPLLLAVLFVFSLLPTSLASFTASTPSVAGFVCSHYCEQPVLSAAGFVYPRRSAQQESIAAVLVSGKRELRTLVDIEAGLCTFRFR